MSKIFLKRVNKEIQNFYEKKKFENITSLYLLNFLNNLSIEVIILDNKHSNDYHLLIKNSLINKIFLQLQIPETYPFTPYKPIIYDDSDKISYFKYINNVYEKIKYKDKKIYIFFFNKLYGIESRFLKLEKNNCYCCSSIFCTFLWSPAYTFNNIIFDHLEIQFIDKYSSNLNYRYLNNIYYNLFNNHKLFSKLPIELINKILN